MENLYEMCKFIKANPKNKGTFVIINDITVAHCVRTRQEELLCWEAANSQLYEKRDSGTSVFLWILQNI